MASEEYLASLGIDTKDADRALDQIITLVANASAHFSELSDRLDKADRALNSTGTAGKAAARGVKDANDEAAQGSAKWREYVKQLESAKTAYKDFRKGSVTGEGGGKDVGSLAEAQQLLSIYDAQNASAVSAARQIVAAVNQSSQAIRAEQATRVQAYTQALALAQQLENANRSAAKSSIAQSDTRIAKVYDANQRDEDVAKLGAVAVATRELADANNRLAAAERAERQASASGDIFAREAAMSRLADATEEARRAQIAYNSETQRAEAATARQANSTESLASSLPRLRYALYDVSSAIGVASGVTLAGVGAAAAISVAWERDFAQVQRTSQATGTELENLRSDFTGLAQEIPETYDSLTKIGTLGGQLNIDPSKLTDFTREVAQFSSTTNVSVDESATAFGRLDSLLPGVGGRYANLGSSILQVGINSVATEGDIISVTSQIAASANQAGLAADEVIGLAGAYASAGIAAESSRGTTLRFFTQINGAVAGTNGLLGTFAAVSGRTAEQFQNDWKTDKSAAIEEVLRGINDQGPGAQAALAALGVTAQRDVSNLLKLSQNVDGLHESFENAKTGFAEGTLLADQYGITSETVASKLQILQNSFEGLVATVGGQTNGPLKFFLDLLGNILKALTEVASSPGLAWPVAFGAGLLTLIAILGLAVAGALRFQAAQYGLQTALVSASEQGALQDNIFTRLGIKLGILTQETLNASLAQRELTTSTAAANGSAGAAAAGGGSKLTSILGKAGLVGSLLLVIPLLDEFAKAASTSGALAQAGLEDIDARVQSLKGNAEATRAAIAAIDTARNATGQRGIPDATNYNVASFFDDSVLGGITGASADLEVFNQRVALAQQLIVQTFQSGNTEGAQRDYEALTFQLQQMGFTQDQINGFTSDYTGIVADAGGQAGIAASQVAELNSQMLDNFNILQQDTDAQLGLGNSLYALGQSLYDNGDAFGYYSAEGRNNIGALQGTISAYVKAFGSDAQSLANNLQTLYNYILTNTSAPAGALAMLRNAIAATGAKPNGMGDSFAVTPLLDGYTASANKASVAAQKSAEKIREQVVTLEDYANDLKGVITRAFDLRFGNDQAFDKINAGWNSMAEAVKKVTDEIAEYRADMASLTADKAVKEYWLSVAEDYGDALRAGQLRAELADIDNQLRKKSEDLTEATNDLSQSTDGNSQSAIDNRADLLNLVGTYQEYITQLASSGLSQDQLRARVAQLKQEFINQATQLGYSEQAVQQYANAFDDLAAAIDGVPRNITVGIDGLGPAEAALKEFIEKIRAQAANAGVSVPVSTSVDTGPVDQATQKAHKLAWANFLAANGGTFSTPDRINQLKNSFVALTGITDGFRVGGPTGPGQDNEVAGLVHRNEYVLNSTGAKMFPRAMLDGANQGRAPYTPQIRLPKAMMGGGQDGGYDRQILSVLQGILASSGVFLPGNALAGAVGGAQVNGANRRRY